MTRHARIALALHRTRKPLTEWELNDREPLWIGGGQGFDEEVWGGVTVEDVLANRDWLAEGQPAHARWCGIWDRDISFVPCNCADAPESEKTHRIDPMFDHIR